MVADVLTMQGGVKVPNKHQEIIHWNQFISMIWADSSPHKDNII